MAQRTAGALALLLALTGAGPVCDANWHDAARNRDVRVRIRLPDDALISAGTVPVVLWSPGLGGDIGGGSVWAQAWTAHGFAVVHLQHPGGDSAVYAGTPGAAERRARIAAATTPAQLAARVGDAGFVLDQLGRRPRFAGCDLGLVDTARAAIAGHSIGAWTAQAIAGQRFAGGATLADPRFRLAIAFSPTAPAGIDPGQAFAGISIPLMAITGTADGAAPAADPAQRAAALALRTGVFGGAPADGRKYQLVFEGADHMMFAGNRLRGDAGVIAARVHAAAADLTAQFLGAWLFDDAEDAASLAPEVVAGRLAPGDRYTQK